MKKALIVVTNIEKYESSNRLTGLWLAELTHFYDELVKAGIEADFVSPNGGYIPLDPHSLAMIDETDMKYYTDENFRNKALAHTLTSDKINPEDYNIIYYTGGHGTMWDFPNADEIGKIASDIYDNGGYISAVCHGVAGLLPIKDKDGNNLIDGKKVTGFTNEEETLNGTLEMVPFLTEDELRNKGANVETVKAFTPHVILDGRLLTGQNPQSARELGKLAVRVLQGGADNE
ncbi:MAG: type 1 glutamine amidotransferase domain-containing protein [Gemella sp.]|nr:type 1 glutamine amidotransferase domain-containing protein [Gemella sp.]